MPEFQIVCIGERPGENRPLVTSWLKLDADGNLTTEMLSFGRQGKKKTVLTGAYLGDVYAVESEDGQKFTVNGSRLRSWDNQEDRRAWRLQETLARTQSEMDRKAKDQDYGEMTLDQLQEQYGRTIGRARRAALLAVITQYITG